MTKGKLTIERYFSEEGVNPYDAVKWSRRDLRIVDERGKHLFTQKNVELPEFMSQNAGDIVGSRYFYGEPGTPEREDSFRTLIERVTDVYRGWGLKNDNFDVKTGDVFKDELTWLTLNQHMSFNSPVWFNVGTHNYESRIRPDKGGGYTISDGEVIEIPMGQTHMYPQTSACFIQYVDDTMEDIMDLAKKEAMLFKDGSGTGTDLSTLRSSKEKLSGGGRPSGPLAYLIFYDDVAGIVKSGGKTRRAAKMDSLKIWHPDIKEFIEAKMNEQKKIRALVSCGYDPKEAADSVHFQNTNFSVRVNDDFMKAVEDDAEWKTRPVYNQEMVDEMPRYKAKDLWELIAKAAWECGDPGLQYEDTINRWHTCPNSGRINASNPCSEYMFLDDSACNLASVNLMKFRRSDGSFDVERFGKALEVTTYAADENIDDSSYPTETIARNAHRFRPLGIGFSNLGSLVMSLGLPYDSDEARATAAAISALKTGKVYEASTKMAESLGTFKEYEKNKEPMLNVMEMHKDALYNNAFGNVDFNKLPEEIKPVYEEAKKVWDNVISRGREHGFRNAQGTVLAPTGTISFMMDCDTTGIEPDIALKKTKRLAEGGTMEIVNGTVPIALHRLGYSPDDIEGIERYIQEHSTIEGSILKEEHLPIFDCAFESLNGKRSIHYNGHIKMMAAVQPFISGAISKTVNMPKDATEKDVENAYRIGWESGLKALAIYRDGSKGVQPLTAGDGKEGGLEREVQKPVRRKLPGTREALVHKFNVAGHEGYLIVGLFPEDKKPGELFINMSKEGSTIGGLMDSVGVLTSFNWQYGVPTDVLCKKMMGNKFEPHGLVFEGGHEIHEAKSLIDYIFNWVGHQFVEGFGNNKDPHAYDPVESDGGKSNNIVDDDPSRPGKFCPVCGDKMIQKGGCMEVCNCGKVDLTGCGG